MEEGANGRHAALAQVSEDALPSCSQGVCSEWWHRVIWRAFTVRHSTAPVQSEIISSEDQEDAGRIRRDGSVM